jgi:hypothetical protein
MQRLSSRSVWIFGSLFHFILRLQHHFAKSSEIFLCVLIHISCHVKCDGQDVVKYRHTVCARGPR